MNKTTRPNRGLRTSKALAKNATDPVGGPLTKEDLPEATVNFFVRMKKSNADWLRDQAKKLGTTHSFYTDRIVDRLRANDKSV
jgi:hypothetical protein